MKDSNLSKTLRLGAWLFGAGLSASPVLLSAATTIWTNNQVLSPNSPAFPYAGIYQFDSLTIGAGVEVTSSNISHLVIKVTGTLTIGSNAVIRVRNGYYSDAPTTPLSIFTSNNLDTLGVDAGGFRLYPGAFGRGGDGGAGANGSWVGHCLVFDTYDAFSKPPKAVGQRGE